MAKASLANAHLDHRRVAPEGLSRRPRLYVVGEAPGAEEIAQGRPFVGAAGRALREMLDEAGIDPRRVRLANAIPFRPIAYSKDRKPRNRSPTIEEVDRCGAAMLKEAMSHLIPGATPQPKRGLSGAAETPLCNLKVCFCNLYVSL
jgi:uracil-DNA glycosylase